MSLPAVTFGATNHFALPANFHVQSSTANLVVDASNILDASANLECETMVNSRTEYSAEYAYCNATPAIATDLNTWLTKFGDTVNNATAKVTEMTITFEAGKYATVSVNGHQHTANGHTAVVGEGYADLSGAVPANAGFGVPTFTGQTWGANASGVRAVLRLTCNHVDKGDYIESHFVGKSITFKAELTMDFVGTPTTALPTGWTQDSFDTKGSNQDFVQASYSFHKAYDITAA